MGSCGFRFDHNVSLFTSPDLQTWTRVGVVFSAASSLPPKSTLFAPKTVYNEKTGLWVLWYNYIIGPGFGRSYYGVATSSTPSGPFEIVNKNVTSLRYTDNGDENLFVDDDGQGFLIYTSLSLHHAISIERLTPDFTRTLGGAASSGPVRARSLTPFGGPPSLFFLSPCSLLSRLTANSPKPAGARVRASSLCALEPCTRPRLKKKPSSR